MTAPPRSPTRARALLCLAALAPGCEAEAPEIRVLRLEEIHPADVRPHGQHGLLLNEELLLVFSADVDPSSVTSDTLRIVSEDGREARGEWWVEGRQVRFRPAPVLAADLSDGGYVPGTRYTVSAAGFPRLSCLRGAEDEPLARSRTWTFETVELTGGQRLFEDVTPGSGAKVTLRLLPAPGRPAVGVGEPIRILCQEPLDPSTLGEDLLWIVPEARPGVVPTERVAVRASFVRNDPESVRGLLEPCAVIELTPVRRLRPGRSYILRALPQLGLTDFGGNRVWPFHLSDEPMTFRVTGPPAEGEKELKLHFLKEDQTRFSPEEVPWADGTAHWGSDGRVEVRFPAAAGSGVDGEVALGPRETRVDVQATRLSLDEGVTCRLAAGGGLRVLRAQGRLAIRGRLERTGTRPDRPMEFEAGEDLSTWLARAAGSGEDWTVLIAGGDLVIDGSVVVETPLLLVAGGWIRINGTLDCRVDSEAVNVPIYKLGKGGGLGLERDPSPAPLEMDPPRPDHNPLAVELRFAALSSPIPASDRPWRWLRAESGGHEAAMPGAGALRLSEYSVRFLHSEGPTAEEEAVIHPNLLKPAGPVKLLIELVVRPGPVWDPPHVDYVDLAWE